MGGIKKGRYARPLCMFVGVRGFEPPTSWSRTKRSNRAEPHPEWCFLLKIF